MTVFRLIQWSALLALAWSVPIDRNVKPAAAEENKPAEEPTETEDTGLYYDRYLREVIDVLETDSHFREKLQAANADDIKSGKLSKELDFVGHHVRSKLDELKRQEVSRLRMLIKAKMDATAHQNVQMDHVGLLKQFEHLDQQNQQTFEAKDLELLIETATRDLESFDSARHEEFKRYEMLKEHERREYLRSLEQEKRESEEKREEERKQRHREHPKINVPGSRDQLKEVWEETDGLDPQEFNPKTFFKLHDSNGDGVLDEQELEALFTKELEKVYDPKNEDDDMTEMEEERLRMREHVMRNVDANHDRLVTLEEFLKSTERKDFANTDEWETVDEKPVYTEEELKQFEAELTAQEAELGKRAEELKREHEDLKERERELELQKKEYQQAVIQMAQKQKAPQAVEGQPPSGPNGELQFHGESKGAAENSLPVEEKKPVEAAPVSDGNPPPAEPPQNQPQQTP